uniref:Uncharacterized protein n=1 Tax=Branchiostoma floridae TaxID=7739 RepID=C3YT98_BRAFL|eukprot:XP_002600453.1 hypothetical protein BRAFLDRAFT_70173 [Branchiostoma floridae]
MSCVLGCGPGAVQGRGPVRRRSGQNRRQGPALWNCWNLEVSNQVSDRSRRHGWKLQQLSQNRAPDWWRRRVDYRGACGRVPPSPQNAGPPIGCVKVTGDARRWHCGGLPVGPPFGQCAGQVFGGNSDGYLTGPRARPGLIRSDRAQSNRARPDLTKEVAPLGWPTSSQITCQNYPQRPAQDYILTEPYI